MDKQSKSNAPTREDKDDDKRYPYELAILVASLGIGVVLIILKVLGVF